MLTTRQTESAVTALHTMWLAVALQLHALLYLCTRSLSVVQLVRPGVSGGTPQARRRRRWVDCHSLG